MFFGIAIVLIGVVFLLQNLGFISASIWQVIWPIMIILFGFSILFKKSSCCGWGSCDKN
jgi:hypothetical protein